MSISIRQSVEETSLRECFNLPLDEMQDCLNKNIRIIEDKVKTALSVHGDIKITLTTQDIDILLKLYALKPTGLSNLSVVTSIIYHPKNVKKFKKLAKIAVKEFRYEMDIREESPYDTLLTMPFIERHADTLSEYESTVKTLSSLSAFTYEPVYHTSPPITIELEAPPAVVRHQLSVEVAYVYSHTRIWGKVRHEYTDLAELVNLLKNHGIKKIRGYIVVYILTRKQLRDRERRFRRSF